MSHGYGGYRTATSPPNYITTHATTSYYTEAHKYYSDPSYYNEAPAYYITEAHLYYTTKAPSITPQPTLFQPTSLRFPSTTPPENRVLRDYVCSPSLLHRGPEYYSAPYYLPSTEAAECCAVPTFYTAASPSYFVDPNYYSEVPVNYTKIYAAPSHYTEALVHCNTKAPEYYTTTYASQTYYTESLKYYSAPSYNTTTASDYYIPTCASLASL
jgi:hypothetical protein